LRLSLDDRSKRGPQDPQRVDIRDDYDLRYWTAALNTPKVRLIAAVAKVGNCVTALRAELEAA
jgi:hypothetical protein